jgi:hypothetical protein
MLSMRAIFRWMLVGWFAAAGLLAIFLGGRMEDRQAGDLVTRIFSEPSIPPATPVLSAEAPRAAKPVEAPPQPVETPKPAGVETGWTPMPNGRAPGKGRIGVPRLAALPDGSLEILLPYQGSLGGETHFTPRDVGIDTRLDALSVDVHGEWEFSRQTDVRLEKSVICRAQIYPHPGYLRVSAIACAQESGTPVLAARIFFSTETLRILFSSSGR